VRKILLSLTLIVLQSCQSNTLRKDYHDAPIDHGYKSAEIIIGEDRYLGVAAIGLDENQAFSFKVAGIYSGVIRVKSDACNYSESKTYSNFAEVEFTPSQVSSGRCLYDIFIEPHFEAKLANRIRWRGVSGILLVRRSLIRAVALASQDESGVPHKISWPSVENTKVFLRGCGFDFQNVFVASQTPIEIEDQIDPKENLCVIDGFARTLKEINLISILISRFDKGFEKLSQPQIKFFDQSISVVADSAVSVIGFNGRSVFSNQAEFLRADGVLRLYAASGRTSFCEIKKGEAKCYQ
jgi:hypothetical protein